MLTRVGCFGLDFQVDCVTMSEILFYLLGPGMVYDSRIEVLNERMGWLVLVCDWVGCEWDCKYLRNSD